jgi:hypothetical protein
VILAIDPGTVQSAWVVWDGTALVDFGIDPNDTVRQFIHGWNGVGTVVIEKIESYGMAVGAEVFETVFWTGRFAEAAVPHPVVRLPRRAVKLHLCGSARAKDANIRQALLDRWGGKAAAMGRKANPGALYGIKADLWAALAVAVTYAETRAPCVVAEAGG